MVPEAEEPAVGHVQHATQVRRLSLVEKEIRLRSVVVLAVDPVKKAQRHQGVQEILG